MKMERARYGAFVLLVTFLLMASGSTLAHESWLLTPEQMLEWNMKPRPEIFTKFTFVNTSLLIFSTLFFGVWLWWDQKENRLLYPGLQARLASYGDYASLVVRCSLALMLIIAAFGLNPRHGTAIFEAPTLIAPDLEIRLLDGDWLWLGWIQAFAAVTLVLGLYVRLTAVIILLVSIVGIVVFGYQMWAYAGIVAASAVYLFMEGAGTFYIRSWIPKKAEILVGWLERQPRGRAQFITRVLTGINLAYLGVEYKFFQPNLSMAFLELQNVFTFGLEHATFTFCMFLVETLAGILLILGALTRLLSVILFIAFFFIAHITGENPIGHVIVYGILSSLFINGAGCWSPKMTGIKFIDVVLGKGSPEGAS
ncbi:hypothetical protein [Sulfuriflexus mobilis]|uniref:hypothetical protein n=1 Tax=Sulfuriflexus mobilis TaxID=1811807 RepID=UPI000F84BFBB|nr:hypothetical protein [Sulfuriflexus mobilis]